MKNSEAFHATTSFKEFCTINHPKWYETHKCYDCKEPWELCHRCKGKGKVHYIEVCHDNEDSHQDETLIIQEGEPLKGKPPHHEIQTNLQVFKELKDEQV